MSREFVEASGSNQLRALCKRRLEDLKLVVLMIDGIHFGGQVLVVALGIAESGEKRVLGVWQDFRVSAVPGSMRNNGIHHPARCAAAPYSTLSESASTAVLASASARSVQLWTDTISTEG
ncbi:MAG: hypothetical protein WAK48_25540 [Candidatus Acidiferrum sp.]